MTRILVVDDEEVVRELTVEILQRSGYKPHGVPSAKDALELLDEEAFDLVVSDVVMPEMTGVEFLYELRKSRPSLPVVLMTGGSKEPERATRAVELGACSLIYKPFSNAELTDAVSRRDPKFLVVIDEFDSVDHVVEQLRAALADDGVAVRGVHLDDVSAN